jgi:hypothetical protein
MIQSYDVGLTCIGSAHLVLIVEITREDHAHPVEKIARHLGLAANATAHNRVCLGGEIFRMDRESAYQVAEESRCRYAVLSKFRSVGQIFAFYFDKRWADSVAANNSTASSSDWLVEGSLVLLAVVTESAAASERAAAKPD